MKKYTAFKKITLGIATLSFVTLAKAGSPLWTFTPLSDTTITVPTSSTATVSYQVTNQSRKTHSLMMTALPGITQTTTPGSCQNPFTLAYQQSCNLTLSVNGNALQGNVVGGPVVCDSGNPLQCYQPSAANSLKITRGTAPVLSTVGGTVQGLNGGTVIVQNNGTNSTTLSSNGAFSFSTPIAQGSAYSVTVQSQPVSQTCTVINGSGTMTGTNVTNVEVRCVTNRAYISNFDSNSISLCSVNSTTGQFFGCQDSGAGAVFNTPLGITIDPNETYLYAANFDSTSGTTVEYCLIDPITGALSACSNADGDGSAVFNGPTNITFNSTGSQAFVSNINSGEISVCSVDLSSGPNAGTFTGCQSVAGFSFPIELQFTSNFTRAYVANGAFNTSISLCSGTLTGCSNADGDGSAVFDGPAFMALDATETRMYVSNNGSGSGTTVALCSVNASTGALNNCQDSGAGAIFMSPGSVNLNAAGSRLYVANQTDTTVTQCDVDTSTGVLSGCVDASGDGSAVFDGPAVIVLK